MRFSRVTLVACLMVLLAILLASPSSGETSNRIESKKMVFDEEANPDQMTTDVERKSVKADKKDKKADDKEEKSDVKGEKTDGESKMTDGEGKKTGGKSKKSKKDKKSKKAGKAKPNGSPKIKSKKSPVNPTGNDKRISSFDASSIAGFVSSVTCGELKLNTFKDVDVTRCLCDDKSCPCVMSSRFPCMCTNCEPTPPGGDFFNCLGCSCLEFP